MKHTQQVGRRRAANLMFSLVIACSGVVASAFTVSAQPPCGTPRGGPCPTATPDVSPTPTPDDGVWTLVWADEFNGTAIDRSNWTFDLGGHGWGNNELQYYTDRPENARLENGLLVIEARQERYRNREYTSARLKTQGLQSWTYGRIEARIKVPFGQGLWPAFWSLGANFDQVSWPYSGEIDFMENIGREPFNVYGTVHGPGYSGPNGVGGHTTLAQPVSDDFHLFAVEWTPAEMRWYVDNAHYLTVTPSNVPGEWVFNHDFFLLLNVAVGGSWPGNPDATTVFPQFMYVDYVRVYQ